MTWSLKNGAKNSFLLDIPLITGWDVCTILFTGALFFFRIIIKKRFDMIDT